MTNTIKYGLGSFLLIFVVYFYNQSSQSSLRSDSIPIYKSDMNQIHRVLITENEKELELVKIDTTWSISKAESLIIKENNLNNLFDRLLKVEKEMLMSTNIEKAEKFGVDDSLGRHLKIFDVNDNQIMHYIFGNSGQDYQHNYIREAKSNDIYRTNDNVWWLLNTSPTYWGKKAPKTAEEEPSDENS